MTLEDYLRQRIETAPHEASFLDIAVVRRNVQGDLLLWIGNQERTTGVRSQLQGFFLVRGNNVTAIDKIEPGCLEEAHRRILVGE